MAPLLVGPPDDRRLLHRGVTGQHRLDRGGPHVLAAADDHLVAPTPHHEPVSGQLAEIAGGEPPVRGPGVGAVAVGAQQRRPAQLHLTVEHPHLDAGERAAGAVDDATPGLGEPVGPHDVGRSPVGSAAPPSTIHR